MAIRVRLAVVLLGVCLLSLSIAARSGQVSATTAEVQISLADILFDHADYRTALGTYLAATRCGDPALRDRARAGVVRAALRLAEFGVAATQLAALNGSGITDPATLALAGDTLWASGRFEDGENAYRNALALAPDSARAHHGMAKALASKSQFEGALGEIYGALRAAPDDSELRHTLGNIYERMHRYSDAASAYAWYLQSLKGADRAGRSMWARSHIAFLRSFDGTMPVQMVWKDGVRHHVLDFRLVEGKVILKGRINGGKPIDLAVDTGAQQTTISEQTARRHNVPITNETLTAGVGEVGLRGLRVGKLDSLEIGPLAVYNLPCTVKTPVIRDLSVDKLDGFSPLALGLSMTIDYTNRKLHFGEPVADASPSRDIPLRFNRLATVQGEANGNPMSFVVDTGGDAISVNLSVARTLFTQADRYPIRLNAYGVSGTDPDAYLLPGVDLAFGSLRLPNRTVAVLNLRAPSVLLGYEIGGILGYRLLGKYRVEIDMRQSVLRLRNR